MQKQSHRNVSITEGALAPNILRFALPLIAARLLQRAFVSADMIVVGHYVGDNALAAVSSTASLINLLLNLFSGLAMGANVLAANALGGRNDKRVHSIVHTSVLLAVLSGTCLMGIGILISPTALRWMGSPETIIGASSLYLRIYFLGMPGLLLYNFGSALLRAGGDTRRPTHYLILAGGTNAALNLVFVLVLHMGVGGVAIATAVSNWISGGMVVRALMKEDGVLHLNLRKLRMNPNDVGQMLGIGIPASVQAVVTSFSNVIIQSSVNSLGEAVMAGSGAAVNLENCTHVIMESFYQACLTFTGQNLGARKLERVDGTCRWCVLLAGLSGFLTSAVFYLFNQPLLGIFVRSPEAIEAGRLRLLMFLFYCFVGMATVLVGSMRGLGESIPPMITSLMGMCGFRVLWVATVFRAHHTAFALFLSYPVSWCLVLLAQWINLRIVRKRVFARVEQEDREEQGRLEELRAKQAQENA